MNRTEQKKIAESLKTANRKIELKEECGIRTERMSKEYEKNKQLLEQIQDNSIHVLINTATVAEDKDGRIYEHIYYLVELDELIAVYTNNNEEYHKNTIDFRDFFSDIGIQKKFYNLRTAIYSADKASKIMNEIINYLFSKNDFKNWEEVSKELKKIKEVLKKPLPNESKEIYKVRALNK